MTLDDFEPDSPMSPEQLSVVETLTPDQLAKIDEDLLANCCGKWRKVARVVATTMMNQYPYPLDSLPDVFFSQRVRLLVEQGLLESQGYLDRMRYSEVRVASANAKQIAT